MACIPCGCDCGCGLAATAPIRPLAWEPPYALGAALEKTKKKKERERQILYDITYRWTLKYDTNDPLCKAETDS